MMKTTSSTWLTRLTVSVTTVGEVLGVGGHAADDLAGGVLVVEGHVALEHGVEGVLAQAEHDVTDHAAEIHRWMKLNVQPSTPVTSTAATRATTSQPFGR